MRKIIYIIVLSFLYIAPTFSQIQIYGEQIRGENKNAELKCESILISKMMKIVKIEGENEGFWIENQDGVLQSFYINEDGTYFPDFTGYELKPGKYTVYPNLLSNKDTATIKIYLE